VELLTVPELKNQSTLPHSFRKLIWLNENYLLASGVGDELSIVDVRTGKLVQELKLGSWARRIDYHADRGIALVTVQDRALVIKVDVPAN